MPNVRALCSEPRLQSQKTTTGRALPETAQVHFEAIFELFSGHYLFRDILVSPQFEQPPPVVMQPCVSSGAKV